MRIASIHKRPLHEIPFRTVGGNGRHTVRKQLQVSCAQVEGLPVSLEGLLVMSDLQGFERERHGYRQDAALLGEVVADELCSLQQRGLVPPPESLGVVLAGDLYARERRRGGIGDVTHVWQAFKKARWVAGVRGNHDLLAAGQDETTIPMYDLDSGPVEVDGFRLGGVGGVAGNPSMPNRRPLEEFLKAVESVLSDSPDLLVLHQGPTPESGQSRKGLRELRDLIRQVDHELLVVFGHERWKKGFEQLTPNVQLLNVHERVVLLKRVPRSWNNARKQS